ncbi:MAG: hypothetical protein JRH11_26670, partial [Deltaproteobacteria bacterium]|nr:hypothetical protein [Deltaproteobacteria bacterium]
MRSSYEVTVELLHLPTSLPADQRYKCVHGMLKKCAKKMKIKAGGKTASDLATEISARLTDQPSLSAASKLLPPKSQLTKDGARLRDFLVTTAMGEPGQQLVELTLGLTQIHPDQKLPPTTTPVG